DVVAADLRTLGPPHLVDLAVVTGDRLGLDAGLLLERVRLVGVAVVDEQPPVDPDRARRPGEQEEPRGVGVGRERHERRGEVERGHDSPSTMIARVSSTAPVASAAAASRPWETGTLPIVSPVRPLTAM